MEVLKAEVCRYKLRRPGVSGSVPHTADFRQKMIRKLFGIKGEISFNWCTPGSRLTEDAIECFPEAAGRAGISGYLGFPVVPLFVTEKLMHVPGSAHSLTAVLWVPSSPESTF